MAQQLQVHRGVSPTLVPFMHDAGRNLRVVRRCFGPQSPCYRRLHLLYGCVARELGCGPAWQRQWHRLRRQPTTCPPRPWPIKAQGA